MGVYVCPVCNGRGFVDAGFYDGASATLQTTTCRSCSGKGIVFDAYAFEQEVYRISDEEARNWIGYCTLGDFLNGNYKK